jgi:hypothetical protein
MLKNVRLYRNIKISIRIYNGINPRPHIRKGLSSQLIAGLRQKKTPLVYGGACVILLECAIFIA